MIRTKGTHLINNMIKATGEITIMAEGEAIEEFRGNVIRHGGSAVTYNQTENGGYDIIASFAYSPDDTNSIEVLCSC